MKFFDYIILVVAPRKIRLKRYLKNGGNQRMFYLLDRNQISAKNKIKYCDYLIVNNKSKNFLKKKVNDIIRIMTEVFLDIETTGLSFKDNHKIVEIACIETNELIPTKKIFHKIINPERNVPEEAFKVHGFSTEFFKK